MYIYIWLHMHYMFIFNLYLEITLYTILVGSQLHSNVLNQSPWRVEPTKHMSTESWPCADEQSWRSMATELCTSTSQWTQAQHIEKKTHFKCDNEGKKCRTPPILKEWKWQLWWPEKCLPSKDIREELWRILKELKECMEQSEWTINKNKQGMKIEMRNQN